MFYFSLKCHSEDIYKEALLFGTPLYKTIDRSLKTVPLVAFPVNPYCWSKSTEHDVTLTSFMTDSKWPQADFFNMCRIVAGRGTANFKAKFPVLQELFAKNHRIKMTSH